MCSQPQPDPAILFKDPAVMFKDPDILFKDQALLFKDPAILFKDPATQPSRTRPLEQPGQSLSSQHQTATVVMRTWAIKYISAVVTNFPFYQLKNYLAFKSQSSCHVHVQLGEGEAGVLAVEAVLAILTPCSSRLGHSV